MEIAHLGEMDNHALSIEMARGLCLTLESIPGCKLKS